MTTKAANISLFEVTNQYTLALSEIQYLDPNSDEYRVKIAEIDGLEGDLYVKLESYALRSLELESLAGEMKLQAKRMADRAESMQAHADNLREHVRDRMAAANIPKLQGKLVQLRRQLNPPSTVIDDESIVPGDYFNEKMTYTLSATRIKDAIRAGFEIPGAHLEQTERLVIK